MKKLLIGVMLMVVNESNGLAQTNFYTNVTNLWYQGYKSNVLNIATARLAANTNDIAGLILKAEYHLAFCEDAAISNAYLRVIQVGDTITTTNFVKCWQKEGGRQDYLDILDYMAEKPLTPQQIQTERLKGLINEKPLPDAYLIEALQKDDYFDLQ
jgi:hypothetical protein